MFKINERSYNRREEIYLCSQEYSENPSYFKNMFQFSEFKNKGNYL